MKWGGGGGGGEKWGVGGEKCGGDEKCGGGGENCGGGGENCGGGGGEKCGGELTSEVEKQVKKSVGGKVDGVELLRDMLEILKGGRQRLKSES
ncbi:hypothetical protein Pmani_031829 [Petrolisthes manimaculis]|uniref:Uncharacterized protein n=1 Tax=Petrolisthes manimaculis TaxID=1843537 RepID=A0AAE1TRL7_9EUCA|nr:hypothetical protein Pmani_031829 [Petrolisthes manimaculis]